MPHGNRREPGVGHGDAGTLGVPRSSAACGYQNPGVPPECHRGMPAAGGPETRKEVHPIRQDLVADRNPGHIPEVVEVVAPRHTREPWSRAGSKRRLKLRVVLSYILSVVYERS